MNTTGAHQVSTISGINQLPEAVKRAIYSKIIPHSLLDRFHLSPTLFDEKGNDLIELHCQPGTSTAELALHHEVGFPDPILYGHITDTLTGQVHILLYVLNDPLSPRFDVDRLVDGTSTRFGIIHRNLEAEHAAKEAGLAPGQVRHGLRLLGEAIQAFEKFIEYLGQDLYFVEPLYYHVAIIFEHYGFSYAKGRRIMERIHNGFLPGGDLLSALDQSTRFRSSSAANSIRLRSWAIHDGLLGEPFSDVTMYKRVGISAGINTAQDCPW